MHGRNIGLLFSSIVLVVIVLLIHGRKIGLNSLEMEARKARRALEPSIPSIERAEPVSKCSDRSSFELRLGTRASL